MHAWSVVLASALVWSCQPTMAKRPEIPEGLSANERQDLYRDYHFRAVDQGLRGTAFQRADGTYQALQLKHVAAMYPETRELHSDSATRSVVISIPAGAGGFGIGYWLGTSLGGGEMDSTTSNVLLFGGLGLIGAAMLTSILWGEPMNEFADVYNRKLREELHVDDTSSQAEGVEVSFTGQGITLAY